MNKSKKIIELKERELELLKRRQNTIAFFRQSMVALEKDLARVQKLIGALDSTVDSFVAEKAPIVTDPVEPVPAVIGKPVLSPAPVAEAPIAHQSMQEFEESMADDDGLDAEAMGFPVEPEMPMTYAEAKGLHAEPKRQPTAVVTSIKPAGSKDGAGSSLEDQMSRFLATA